MVIPLLKADGKEEHVIVAAVLTLLTTVIAAIRLGDRRWARRVREERSTR